MSPTAFERLAQQYRDWSATDDPMFRRTRDVDDVDDFVRRLEGDLARAKLAVVDRAFGDFAPGDYVLVWSHGDVIDPVARQATKRLVAWAGRNASHDDPTRPSLLLDVQDHVRVIWERV